MTADDPVSRLAIMDILKARKGPEWNSTNQGDRVSGCHHRNGIDTTRHTRRVSE